MLWIIIGFILWIAGMVVFIISGWDREARSIAGFALGGLLLIGCYLVNGLCYEPDMQTTTETRVIETKKLYALQDNVRKKGTFSG